MASNFRSQQQPLPHQVQKVHVKKVYIPGTYISVGVRNSSDFAISRIHFRTQTPAHVRPRKLHLETT
jgi:hypothetical protein